MTAGSGHTGNADRSDARAGHRLRAGLLGLALLCAASVAAADSCSLCAAWNQDQKPFRIYGNTYYVGVHGLASILVTSGEGDVLIDGDLAESVQKIAANIRALGFRVEDVKLILNTHAHYDHAAGIAQLQRLSGARVAASAWSARVLSDGRSSRDDPQYGILPAYDRVANVEVLQDGQTMHVGALALTAHLTPGHTPGGTTWTWKSCENGRCLDVVYADSLTPVAAPHFRFSDTVSHPRLMREFEASYATLSALPCDILVTPHPEASDLWARLARRDRGERDALVDPSACRRLAESSRALLEQRVAAERNGRVR